MAMECRHLKQAAVQFPRIVVTRHRIVIEVNSCEFTSGMTDLRENLSSMILYADRSLGEVDLAPRRPRMRYRSSPHTLQSKGRLENRLSARCSRSPRSCFYVHSALVYSYLQPEVPASASV
jgi:hypothetical protein